MQGCMCLHVFNTQRLPEHPKTRRTWEDKKEGMGEESIAEVREARPVDLKANQPTAMY